MVVAGESFARLFTDDPAVVGEFALYLEIAAWGYAGFGLLIVGNGIMNAVDKASFALVQSVVRVFLVMLPVALVLQGSNGQRGDLYRRTCRQPVRRGFGGAAGAPYLRAQDEPVAPALGLH